VHTITTHTNAHTLSAERYFSGVLLRRPLSSSPSQPPNGATNRVASFFDWYKGWVGTHAVYSFWKHVRPITIGWYYLVNHSRQVSVPVSWFH